MRESNSDAPELAYCLCSMPPTRSNIISVLNTRGALLYQRKGNDSLNAVMNAIDQALIQPRKKLKCNNHCRSKVR
jgi:hypothetical protein